jgi:hypothetical protein
MTTIKARLACAIRLQECPDQGRPGASGPCLSHGSVTMEIDWLTAEALNEASQPICSVFIAKVCLRTRARAP